MFWPLALVAVRQHQGDAVDTAPLDLTRGNELVNHHLCAIDKIPELSLPDDQRVGVVGRVAVFKSQHRLFRQNRVDHHKRGLPIGHVLQGGVSAFVKFFTILVMDDRVSVGEGASARVFAAQAHRVAARHQ